MANKDLKNKAKKIPRLPNGNLDRSSKEYQEVAKEYATPVSEGVYEKLKSEGYKGKVKRDSGEEVVMKGKSSGDKGTMETKPIEQEQQNNKNLIKVTNDAGQIQMVDPAVLQTLPSPQLQEYEKDKETMSNLELQEKYRGTTIEDMPSYQKLLLGEAVVGASPQVFTTGARTVKSATKLVTDFPKITGFIKKVGTGIVGMSGIMQWLASDNYMSTLSMYGRDMYDAVKWDGMDKDEAIKTMDEKLTEVQYIKEFTKTNTMLNPLMWPFRKLIIDQLNAAEESFMLQQQKISLL